MGARTPAQGHWSSHFPPPPSEMQCPPPLCPALPEPTPRPEVWAPSKLLPRSFPPGSPNTSTPITLAITSLQFPDLGRVLPRDPAHSPATPGPTRPAPRQQRQTWGGHQAGLEGAWLGGGSWARALHGGAFLRAAAGQGLGRPAAPLQSLLDGGRVGGQAGQLVEDAALPDDGVHQAGVACGEGEPRLREPFASPTPACRASWDSVNPGGRRRAQDRRPRRGGQPGVCANGDYTTMSPFWERASQRGLPVPLPDTFRTPSRPLATSTKGHSAPECTRAS